MDVRKNIALALLLLVGCNPRSAPSPFVLPEQPLPDSGISQVVDANDAANPNGFDAGSVAPDAGTTTVCLDLDGDGYGVGADCLGPDCDDDNPFKHPGIIENAPPCDDPRNPACAPDNRPYCDGQDNNCDDNVDEDCPCREGAIQSCYSGSLASLAHGRCSVGYMRCEQGTWSPCEGAIEPEVEVCNGHDDNCDGSIDEGLINACGGCGVVPDEVCNGRDDDCDGEIDEGLINACGGCGEAPDEVCDGIDNDCDGQVDEELRNACGGCGPLPEESCGAGGHGNGVDDNCDGEVDEGCFHGGGLSCDGRENQPCYEGPAHTAGRGLCRGGLRDCINEAWGACEGQVLPADEEVCDNGLDDNCDGQIDEGCGPDDCVPEPERCDDAIDNNCDGRINEDCAPACIPEPELCGNGVDEDCDGDIDEGCLPMGCEAREEVCNQIDDDCDGLVDEGVANACGGCGDVPAELCGDSQDNDCDGVIDENCGCIQQPDWVSCDPDQPNQLAACRVCYAGDPDTVNVGVCRGGLQRCSERWEDRCRGQVLPSQEVCDGLDNDCDGEVDEGLLNRCGSCGAEPLEVCDGLDNDCDGEVDEEVLNACGQCGEAPAEVCDGQDNDCDGEVDEGVSNRCGQCGAEALEVCNGEDDDCDGEVDEGVRNACGGCGPTPEEICNGVDDDCDGIIDEGAVNACGRCGEPCYDFEWTGVDAWNAGDREGTEVDPQQGVTLGQSQWSMPFIWIANSGENTVSKLNTDTGREVGRYRMPSGTSSPSRTAVDLDGNVWVGLRGGGSAVKIALAEADCIDRNNNGQIETSRDNNNNGRIDGGELLNTGADECLVLDVRPGGSCIRAVAIDAENRVWAGEWDSSIYYVIDGSDGRVVGSVAAGGNPYGAVIDGYTLWSSNRGNNTLARIDVRNIQRTGLWNVPGCGSLYGIAVDPRGRVWIGNFGCGDVLRFDPNGNSWRRTSTGGMPRGMGVTADGVVYTGIYSSNQVGRINSDTMGLVARYNVGESGVIGLALDDSNHVWAVNQGSSTATKMTLDGNVIGSYPVGRNPYTYSDMTGQALRTFTVRNGTWTRRFDSGRPPGDAVWHQAIWEANLPAGTSARLRFRSGDNPGATDAAAWTAWTSDNPASLAGVPMGRYLDVQVQLQSNGRDTRPFFRGVEVSWWRP